MVDEKKVKKNALLVALEFQTKDTVFLNNVLNDIKVRYNISDGDWIQMSVAFSTLTSREVLSKIGSK